MFMVFFLVHDGLKCISTLAFSKYMYMYKRQRHEYIYMYIMLNPQGNLNFVI